MPFDPNDLFQVAQAAKDHGTPYVAKEVISGCQNERMMFRRKAALFIGNLLGHRLTAKSLTERPDGRVIGQCENCQMVVKLGKDRGVEGRMVELECPARGPRP